MALRIENLSIKTNNSFIIKDISLKFDQSLGLIGPSGCGKTTLAKAILGLIDWEISGRIYFDEKLLQKNGQRIVGPHQRKFAHIPQDLALWPHLNVIEHLHLSKLFAKKTRLGPEEILKLCGLQKKRDFYPKNLSGGEKQRLAIARALVGVPKLLVLDEPFSGLDLVAKEKLIYLIKDLQSRFGFLSFFISHDLNEVLALASSIAIMHQNYFWHGLPKDISEGFPKDWNLLKVQI
jgi:ABC-type multidrug transport system ATPase subunit